VNSCGVLGPGNFVLSKDLHSSTACLTLRSPGSILDLDGHTITGPWQPCKGPLPCLVTIPKSPSFGILLAHTAVGALVESTFPGASVSGFLSGIEDLASRAVIEGPNLLVQANLRRGVWVSGTTGSKVEQLSLSGDFTGIEVQQSSKTLVRRNVVAGTAAVCSTLSGCEGTALGIWVDASDGTSVMGNVISAETDAGVYLGCSDHPMDLKGVGCPGSEGSNVENNYLLDNVEFGIVTAIHSLDNNITENDVAGGEFAQLEDYNPRCAAAPKSGITSSPNTWTNNVGTPNQTVSTTCMG
jgi:hypothetical protein